MRKVIISQAHVSSERLPGKILKEIREKSIIGYHIEQLKRVKHADCIVIATSTKTIDDIIIDICNDYGVECFRGSDSNVLSRYYHAAKAFSAEAIIRVTSDCPLIDPNIIDKVIDLFANNEATLDYASNLLARSYPRGMDVEIFSLTCLAKLYHRAQSAEEREHVTFYLRQNPHLFKIANLMNKDDTSYIRVTLDYPDDLELIKLIIESLYPSKPDYTLEDITNLLSQHPSWLKKNEIFEQNRKD